MDLDTLTSYYIGLLAIQVTVLTLIAAGVIALYQIHDKQAPKRDFSKIVQPRDLILYFISALLLVLATAIFTWSSSGAHNIFTFMDLKFNNFVRLIVMLATLLMCGMFFYLLWKSRTLLDAKKYLETLSKHIKHSELSDYLFNSYSQKPFFISSIFFAIGAKKQTKKQEAKEKKKAKENEVAWEERMENTASTANPLSPFVDYCRNNATTSSGDVESVGLPILEKLVIDYAKSKSDDSVYVPKLLEDSNIEFKESFSGSSQAVKKRYLDMLKNIAEYYCIANDFNQMINVSKLIHYFLKGQESEELKQYGVRLLRELTDKYVSTNEKEKDWRKFDRQHQEFALVVCRIAEHHYHNVKDLPPVPIIENNRTEMEDFAGEIANYFAAYDNLTEKYPDIIPIIYLDAIDVSAEALINAVNRSNVIKNDIGLSTSRYEQTINTLYFIFYTYGKFAIEKDKVELIKACIYRLTRAIKFMKNKNVDDCALDVADTLVSLGIMIACSAKMKNERAYGRNLLVDEIAKYINLYADTEKLAERKSSIEHTLFEFVDTPEAIAFERKLIGW
jgi:hypothetical protein